MEIVTDRLEFAAYLKLQKLRLVAIEPKDGKIINFVFQAENESQAQAVKAQYMNGMAQVPARPYAHTISQIKAIIKSVREEQEKVPA